MTTCCRPGWSLSGKITTFTLRRNSEYSSRHLSAPPGFVVAGSPGESYAPRRTKLLCDVDQSSGKPYEAEKRRPLACPVYFEG